MIAALDLAGNPSSVHAEGRKARSVIEEARRAVADLVNVKAEQVTFTSGATEAANLALTPDYRMGRGALRMSKLYLSAVEHPAVLAGGRFGGQISYVIPVDSDGRVAPAFPLAGKVDAKRPDGGGAEKRLCDSAERRHFILHPQHLRSPPPSDRSAATFPARGKAGAFHWPTLLPLMTSRLAFRSSPSSSPTTSPA